MSDLDFGPLILGSNTFGWTSDARESFEVLDRFLEAGGRAIDTADVYGAWVPGNHGGEAETILGDWMKSRGCRDRVIVATKVFELASRPGLSPQNIRAAIEDSLMRLRTDYVDVYFAHHDDATVPQLDYISALDELVIAGKVRELGASNFSIERVRSAHSIAKDAGLTPFSIAEDKFNLVDRDLLGVIPELVRMDITEVPYSSLAGGFLTGKYRQGVAVDSARAGRTSAYLDDSRNVDLLLELARIAASYEVSVTAVALAWSRQQVGIAAPIASARTAAQLDLLIESFELRLTDEHMQILSAMPTSSSSTPYFTEFVGKT